MKFIEWNLKGVFEIELEPIKDDRGFFMRTYDYSIFRCLNLNTVWVQENHSYSGKRYTLRGLHLQYPPYSEVKLVRAISGVIFMVCVDLREGSNTLGQWQRVILSDASPKMLYIPKGFALGMCSLTDDCSLLYKMGNYYNPDKQGVIKWDDKDIGIDWGIDNPILSDKDSSAGSFKDFLRDYGGLES